MAIKQTRPTKQALRVTAKAIESLGTGEVRRAFDVSYECIYKWKREGIPPKRVVEFVSLVNERGGKVTCHDIRPDCFPASI